MKKKNLLGLVFILGTLALGSFFITSWAMIWGTHELTPWIIPVILSFIYVWLIFDQLIMPMWREGRKPRTQRQAESIRPFFQLVIMLVMSHICLSIALAGLWLYHLKSEYLGIEFGAIGLFALIIPIGYAVLAAIRLSKR